MPGSDGSIRIDTKIDESGYDKGINSLSKKGAAAAKGIAVAMAAVGAAGVVALGAAVRVGMEFDKQMSAVAAKTGATKAQFDALRDSAIALGSSTAFSATEVAQGMEIVGAAGFETNQILSAMPGILDTAAAAGSDIATVTDIMTASMAGFNLTADDTGRIGDVLAKAANLSSASIEDLGMSLKYVAPIAKVMGMSIEDTAAALALMANSGIKADMAGTSLRMALSRLAAEPKKAGAAMKKYGIEIADAHGKIKPFPKLLGEMQKAFAGMEQKEKIAAATAIFGTEAATGMLAVIDASPAAYKKMKAAMDSANGSAKEVAATMRDNLAGDVEEAGGAVESFAIKVTDAFGPNLRNLVQQFTDTLNGIQSDNMIGGIADALVAGLEGFLKAVPELTPKLAEALRLVIDKLAEAVPVLVPPLAEALSKSIEDLAPVLLEAIGKLGLAVAEAFATELFRPIESSTAEGTIADIAVKVGLLTAAIKILGTTSATAAGASGLGAIPIAAAGILGIGLGQWIDDQLQKFPGYQKGWDDIYTTMEKVGSLGKKNDNTMTVWEWLTLPPEARQSWLDYEAAMADGTVGAKTAEGASRQLAAEQAKLATAVQAADAKVAALKAQLDTVPKEKRTDLKADIKDAEAKAAAAKKKLDEAAKTRTANINVSVGGGGSIRVTAATQTSWKVLAYKNGGFPTGPMSGYLAELHGDEVVAPLSNPGRFADLIGQAMDGSSRIRNAVMSEMSRFSATVAPNFAFSGGGGSVTHREGDLIIQVPEVASFSDVVAARRASNIMLARG